MSNIPPQVFAAYPRGNDAQGFDASRLEGLMEGYFATNRTFGYHFLLYIVSRVVCIPFANSIPDVFFLSLVALWVVMFFINLPVNKKLGPLLGWKESGPVVASICNAVFGLISYAVVGSKATQEMYKMGVRKRFFGVRKKDIQARLQEIRNASSAPIPTF